MKNLKETISKLRSEFSKKISSAKNLSDIEKIRILFLGKKGTITELLPQLKTLSIDEKREFGPLIQSLRKEVEETLKEKLLNLAKKQQESSILKSKHFDVTAYKPSSTDGHLHPYSRIIEEIEDIFTSMGYEIFDGPEVDKDYYNFTAVNIPQDHPARDMYDTFWLDIPGMLLRTHTSSVQAHAMKNKKLPIAIAVPGRCYRHEAVDASHDVMFMQCEGLLIDKKVSLSNLFATAQHFLQALFKKKNLNIRIRPGFFPFVEPGIEIDMQCPFCTSGCSVCKKTKWIEVFPAGLIHPNVLREAGIDPDEYSGFAFGFGLTRLAMIRYGINDIRLLHSGKIKFLEQF
jgi:phenylalanyl-tRNA synthetase alpha chain